jgi:acetylornithine/succinyldiaminopimelate/putrescine aminotransferase
MKTTNLETTTLEEFKTQNYGKKGPNFNPTKDYRIGFWRKARVKHPAVKPGLSMRFLLKMLKRGLMWCASWDYNTMIALPPLMITPEDCNHALNIIEDTAKEMFPKR